MKKRKLLPLLLGIGIVMLSITACEFGGFAFRSSDNNQNENSISSEPAPSSGGNSNNSSNDNNRSSQSSGNSSSAKYSSSSVNDNSGSQRLSSSSVSDSSGSQRISSSSAAGSSSKDSSSSGSNSSSNIPVNALSSIEVTHAPTKTTYQLNEQADYTGLEITAHFTVDNDRVIPQSSLTISGFDSSSTGQKTIGVSYTFEAVTKSTSFYIDVINDTNVVLDFYGFNDTHGNVVDSTLGVGIAKTTTFMKDKIQGQNSLLISSGDMWQGSLESNSNRGALMTKWMQQLNFTSMTIGNHEFDWGTQVIKDNATNYDLPILGINIIDKTTGKRADYVTPSVVVNRGGAKIGIIGAVGDCYSSISYSKVMDVEFILDKETNNKPLTSLIKAESTRLRQEEGCDFIVYSFHGDSIRDDTYYNLELSTGHYVDLVFEGHKHKETHYQDDGGVWHFQSEADDKLVINHLKVNLNVETDAYNVSFSEDNDVYYMNTSDKYLLEEDADTVALINEYNFAPYYVPLGTNTAIRYGNYLRQLVSDLYLEKALEKWPTYANQITLGGGYISVRGDAQLPVGDVTYAKLYNLFPFDNDILLMKVSGSVLKDTFINTTNSNYFLAYTTYGSGLRDDQTTINNTSQYYVVSDTYTYDHLLKYNNPIKVDSYSTEGYYARDAMADYASAGRFDTGEVITHIDHAGTINDPYSISDALALSNENSVWGYFKGKVSDDSFTLNTNYFQNVLLEDVDDSTKTMNIYKLHRHDNDTSDNELNYGFTSKNELPVGSEVLFFGNVKDYTSGPGAGSTNFAVTINGSPASGLTATAPTSVMNYVQAANLNLENNLYVFGKVKSVTKENNSIVGLTIKGEHTVDYAYSHVSSYTTEITFGRSPTYTYASGLSVSNIVEDAAIVIQIVNGNVRFVSVADDDVLPESTLENPYTVTQAMQVAAKYTAQSGAPYIYCTGIVSRQGDTLGGSKDIRKVYIKDPATNKEIMIYYLKRYQGAPSTDDNFTSVDDIKLGDELVICGQAFNYNGNTLEFGSGTYCITINDVVQGPRS